MSQERQEVLTFRQLERRRPRVLGGQMELLLGGDTEVGGRRGTQEDCVPPSYWKHRALAVTLCWFELPPRYQ